MNTEKKYFNIEVKADEVESARVIKGYGNIFNNVDSYFDIVMPGAFAKSISSDRKVKLLFNHNHDEVLGRIDVLKEDEKGLYFEAFIAETDRGNEVYELLKSGCIDSCSIGYITKEYEYDNHDNRLIKEVDLYEISVVVFPANELATVDEVKTVEDIKNMNIKEFEANLRDAGFTLKSSKYIASMYFKGVKESQREVDASEAKENQEANELKSLIETNIKLLESFK